MKSSIIILLAMILTFTAVSAEDLQLKNIRYNFIYDPLENKGLLFINVEFNVKDCSFIYVPVDIARAEYVLLNYTVEGNVVVDGVDYNSSEGYLDAFVCGYGILSVLFAVSNLFEETGLLSYYATIDTSELEYTQTPVQVEISIYGNFTVILNTIGNASAYIDELNNVILIQGYGQVDIVLVEYVEELTVLTSTTQYTSSTYTTQLSSHSSAGSNYSNYTTLSTVFNNNNTNNLTSSTLSGNTETASTIPQQLKPAGDNVTYVLILAVLTLSVLVVLACIRYRKWR
ncbi:MAG: hypothetical protein QXJ97_07800 [Desulfurococcaceae archaeon]